MKRRVVVTGIGAVTSLGCKVEELWTRICKGESGIGPLERLDVADYSVRFGGEIHGWSTDGYIPAKDIKRFDRFVQFSQVAGVDAVVDSGIDFSQAGSLALRRGYGFGHRRSGNDRGPAPAAARQRPGQNLGLHHPQAHRQRRQCASGHSIRPARPESSHRHRLRQRHQRDGRRLPA